jgi:hypothetical protein
MEYDGNNRTIDLTRWTRWIDRYGAITIAICNNNKSIYLSIVHGV